MTTDGFPTVGLHYGATDISMPVLELAHAAAERGLESLVLPEHTHIPTSQLSQYPKGPMPPRYKRLLDPYVALAFVAAQTGLAVGTCISLVAQRDPVILAKEIATIDHLSGGRMLAVGVGYGWNKEQFDHHRRGKFSQRRALVREHVAIMRSLWRDDEAQYEGEHVSLSTSWMWPKPVQRPSPPVLLGSAAGEKAFAEIVGWADGWIPGGYDVVEWLPEALERLRRQWAEAGRPEAGPMVAVMQGPAEDAELVRRFDLFRSLGVHHVFLDVPSEPADVVMPLLDGYARVLDSLA